MVSTGVRNWQASGMPSTSYRGRPEDDSRSELLRGARYVPETKGAGGIRTADEIRTAYGRSNSRSAITPCWMYDTLYFSQRGLCSHLGMALLSNR